MSSHRFSACDTKVKHTRESAEEKIAMLETVKRKKVKGLHSYKCQFCDGYHLTSRLPEADEVSNVTD